MAERLTETWTTRDRPVLVDIVRRFDEETQPVALSDVADATGIDLRDVQRAATQLHRGNLIELASGMGGPRTVLDISAEALRISGLWPDAGDAFDRLIWNLEERIAEAPPEEKGKLTKIREAIVGAGRDIAVDVIGGAITGRIPM